MIVPDFTVLGDRTVLLRFDKAKPFENSALIMQAKPIEQNANYQSAEREEPTGLSEQLAKFSGVLDDMTGVEKFKAACVQGYTARLLETRQPWIVDCVPAYDTLCVHYDPVILWQAGVSVSQWFDSLITFAYVPIERNRVRAHRIPVCYDPPFGEDLPWVASTLGMSETEVITLHLGGKYQVAMVGFAPGFPYLVGLPPLLRLPRRATPRSAVPAGSVAIAELQCGIYPRQLPGGWHLLGRTPTRLFNPDCASPCLLQAGDAVEFYAISPAEFEVLSQ